MKIAVGMSGGIDSNTTALLLKEQHHEVIGVTMFLFDHQRDEIEHARQVCNSLRIPHHVLDYRKDFEAEVITAFIRSYEHGETPNPCIHCNRIFKYGKLIDDIKALGAQGFATGHYVRVLYNEATHEFEIHKAVNERKDQSYNLFHLTQEIIRMLHFPLGEMPSKDAVRHHFQSVNLETAKKKDSLGICFIEHKQHELFLKALGSSSMSRGPFVDKSGKILGYHQGIAGYTPGQKKGLPLKESGKYVVIDTHPATCEIVLGDEDDLLKYEIHSDDFNFISEHQSLPAKVSVKVSQWSTIYSGILSKSDTFSTEAPSSIHRIVLTFGEPVRAPAIGQAVVCYDDTKLLGGGTIHRTY